MSPFILFDPYRTPTPACPDPTDHDPHPLPGASPRPLAPLPDRPTLGLPTGPCLCRALWWCLCLLCAYTGRVAHGSGWPHCLPGLGWVRCFDTDGLEPIISIFYQITPFSGGESRFEAFLKENRTPSRGSGLKTSKYLLLNYALCYTKEDSSKVQSKSTKWSLGVSDDTV